jgi:alkyl sulfatase BDS1-like metallo-beta-lactamase superfamily hydrolase
MERLKEIKEKGADSATPEDIPIGLDVITDFLNNNPDAQNLIKDIQLKASFTVEDVDTFLLTVSNGKSEFAKKSESDTDFKLSTKLKTITEVLIGQSDAAVEWIKGNMEVDGDFEKMVDFFGIMELAYDSLGIVEPGEREVLIDAKTMRKLYNVYMDGAKDIDPDDIPLIMDIFCTFANLNAEAQEVLEDEEYTVQMVLTDIGKSYVVRAKDNKVSWAEEDIDDASLKFSMALTTAADIFLSGDAAQAFLGGKIDAEGNIAEALVLNDVITVFLDLLPFAESPF